MFPNALVLMGFVFGIREAIRHMDCATFDRCPADTRGAVRTDRMFREKLDVGRLGIVGGRNVILSVLQFKKQAYSASHSRPAV